MLYLITGIILTGILVGYLSVKGNPSEWLGFVLGITISILAILLWPVTLLIIWIYYDQFINWIREDL